MTPTMKLRFITRRIKTRDIHDDEDTVSFLKILQQWFVYSDAECHKRVANEDYTTGEWVDVPLEEKL